MIAAAAAAHTTRRQPECRNSHISGWSPPRLHSKFCFERRKEAGRRRGSRPLQGRQKKPDKSGEASANTPKRAWLLYDHGPAPRRIEPLLILGNMKIPVVIEVPAQI